MLMLAGHGETNGLTVNGKIIPLGAHSRKPALRRRTAASAFLVLPGRAGQRARADRGAVPGLRLQDQRRLGESAFTEFIYLDMILEKGLSPAAAAEQLVSLVRFAGAEEIPGSPYRPAGFCFFGSAMVRSSPGRGER